MQFGLIPECDKARTNDPQWVRALMSILEAERVESVWMPEHVVMAEEYEPLYEYSEDGRAPVAPTTMMPDPIEWLTFAAAVSENVLLGTSVLIGPQHSAAVLAKRIATLDALSSGRLQIGIGIGWQKEEYEAVGVPYRNRGQRLDETLDAMRILWSDNPATFKGDFIQFDRVHCDTKPAQADGVPFHIGGSSEAAARRAGLRGNGFFPYVISPDDLAARMETVRATAQAAGRSLEDFAVTVWPSSWRQGAALDVALARDFRAAGATRLVFSAQECGSSELSDLQKFIARYRDELIGAI